MGALKDPCPHRTLKIYPDKHTHFKFVQRGPFRAGNHFIETNTMLNSKTNIIPPAIREANTISPYPTGLYYLYR